MQYSWGETELKKTKKCLRKCGATTSANVTSLNKLGPMPESSPVSQWKRFSASEMANYDFDAEILEYIPIYTQCYANFTPSIT